MYEELWHGEAFSDFLRSYGLEVPAEPKLPDGSTPLPTRPRRTAQLRERLGVGHKLALLPSMVGSAAMKDFVALHTTWGAINELTTPSGYTQLIRRSDHPQLHAMLRQIIRTSAATSPSTAPRLRHGWPPTRAPGGSYAGFESASGRRSAQA